MNELLIERPTLTIQMLSSMKIIRMQLKLLKNGKRRKESRLVRNMVRRKMMRKTKMVNKKNHLLCQNSIRQRLKKSSMMNSLKLKFLMSWKTKSTTIGFWNLKNGMLCYLHIRAQKVKTIDLNIRSLL